ncbi:cytochrome P450 6A1-like [Phlebotomus papatasi]|uniref:cytochrome P450 6A1-like n=1 Tax=Phlebotomus papatasi TaxID=29031 RepID=UPI00248392C9|nr:cytochrome P450 6A1-like [Phlebotomus papatasi]
MPLLFFSYLHLYVRNRFLYWKKRGVPYVKPVFPFGILKSIGSTKHSSQILTEAYKELKGKNIFGGIYFFTKPVVVPTDLDFLKNILVQDFQYFTDRGFYVNEKDDPLSGNLIALSGHRWRNLRTKVSPTFTSGKMKMMHNIIVDVAKELQNYFEPIAKHNEAIEIKDILSRFTIDVIGNCAFGIECNSLKQPNTEFCRIGKKVFEYTAFEYFNLFFLMMFPNLGHKLKIKINKSEVTEFFMRLLKETIEYREKNDIKRNDFLSLLMQIKNTGKLEGDDTDLGKITFEELAAQMFLFFAAGYETSSSTMAFALYELALHQDIQDKAREEVNCILKKYNGEYSYEACMEMKYIDQIIKETLRKYPIVDFLVRRCGDDYAVPGTKHSIEKGTFVTIPVYGIHHDPEIYPDPQKFDPERFTEDNIKIRRPFAWLPFGEGPKNCLGMKFGMTETRIGLATLLSKYRVSISSKTGIPLALEPASLVMTPKGGLWLNIEMVS